MTKRKSAATKTCSAIVIGAGASGLTAAIFCAANGGDVCVLERDPQPARKLLRTGNGRCNFTNELQGPSYYRGTDPSFINQVLSNFDLQSTLDFFFRIGIYPRSLGGYLYPYSLQAKDVKLALEQELNRLGVCIHCGTRVTAVRRVPDGFELSCDSGGTAFRATAKTVILSCGSSAGLPEGTPDDAAALLTQLSVPQIPRVPALCALRCSDRFCPKLHGIRAKGAVTLWCEGKDVRREEGEIQFTDYGISGIPVFCISRDAARLLQDRKKITVTADLMPELSESDVAQLLWDRRFLCEHSGKPVRALLLGLFAPGLCDVLEQFLANGAKAPAVPDEAAVRTLAKTIKALPFRVTGTKGMAAAQTAAGGADLSAVDPADLQCRSVPGLFLTGETLDCDGICGGYNLQWAWSTGALAGMGAARYLENVPS